MTAVPDNYPPLDMTTPQLTVRAVATGMVLGGVLSICNIYAGLKIGWGMNMSVTAALLGFAAWQSLRPFGGRPLSILESNINQTAASAAASVSSAGLVAPIPALTILTGREYDWPTLVVWTLSVMLVGIVVGIGVRRQLIVVDRLPFPGGLATAETLKQIYARGSEAVARVRVLGIGAAVAAVIALVVEYAKVAKWPIPGAYMAPAAVAHKGIAKITLGNLTFMLDPSPLMAAVGVLVGLRASASLFLGSVISFGVLAPWTLALGWSTPGPDDPTKPWFAQLSGSWLLWPGVSMMVTSSLTSLAFSWRSMLRAFRRSTPVGEVPTGREEDVPRNVYWGAIVAVTAFATATQVGFFGITWWTAVLGTLLTFLLALVAGRVSGETNVTPVGAMGKVTQLLFGLLQPGSAAANLMAANVTGGAASQTGDILHDLKTGALLGASPRKQAVAQTFGALSGALAGSAAYLIIVPDARRLGTEEWPAPAVQTWKAVAELFMRGIEAAAPGTVKAMFVAGAAGIILAVLEKVLPKKLGSWVPSPASMGLGFVIPAYQGLSMFAGAIFGALATRWAKSWSDRFLIVLAAGFIAGESLTGVGIAIQKILSAAGGL